MDRWEILLILKKPSRKFTQSIRVNLFSLRIVVANENPVTEKQWKELRVMFYEAKKSKLPRDLNRKEFIALFDKHHWAEADTSRVGGVMF